MKLASSQEQAKLLTRNYQLLSVVLFCFCSNGGKKASVKGNPLSLSQPAHTGTITIHYRLLPLLFSHPRTSFHLLLVNSLLPSIRLDPSTPPSTIRCAISHLRRAVPPLNGIIIGPALLLIAKATIGRTCARLKARAMRRRR